MTIQNKYIKLLKILRKKYGNGVKDNFQLNDIGKSYFKKSWGGVYPYDLAKLNKKYFIVNTDSSKESGTHWIACFKKGKTIYVYDSFGRLTKNVLKNFYKTLIGKGYTVTESRRDAEQSGYQEDCGIRCIAWLIIVELYGIHEALKI